MNEENEIKKKRLSVLETYGDNLSDRTYITNPAIGRDNEIKQTVLSLLTPDKSVILTGKPGVGKTAIVEGLAYRMQIGNIPDILKDYTIIKMNTSALVGMDPTTGESKVQNLIEELKTKDKLILFIDEIHTLMGKRDESMDFANIFKPGLDRGTIKVIGATTNDEYERFILRDKAFVRRFERVDVDEPSREHTIEIALGTLPKIEKRTKAVMLYTPFIQSKIAEFLTDLTSEYRRVYEIGSRYPDIVLTLFQNAFSYAVFDNRKYVNILDVRKAIMNTKNVYPDVIKKELVRFDEEFKDQIEELEEYLQQLKGGNNA